MLRHIIPTALTFLVLSQTPAYAQGEGRRSIKAKDLQKEDLSAALKEAAHQNRLDLIAKYEEVLSKDSIQGDQRASLLFRVAEQYFEEGKYYFFKEMESFQVEYDKCFNTKGCNIDKMKPDHKKSKKWLCLQIIRKNFNGSVMI